MGSPTYGNSGLTSDIESYLENHPEYDPKSDGMVDKFGKSTTMGMEFNYQREVYWVQRTRDAGLCTLMCQGMARQLTRYYDYHETFTVVGWEMPDSKTIGMDLASIPLSFYGSNYRAINSESVQKAVNVANALNTTSGLLNEDPFVVIVSAIGVYPPAGPFAAFAILTYDLGKGQYFYNYTPPIQR